jgi:hypothetical protein
VGRSYGIPLPLARFRDSGNLLAPPLKTVGFDMSALPGLGRRVPPAEAGSGFR